MTIMAQAALDFAASLGVEPTADIMGEINTLANMEDAFEQAIRCARSGDEPGYQMAMARFRNLNDLRSQAA